MIFLKQTDKAYFFCSILIILLFFSDCTPRNCNTKTHENAELIFQLRDKNTGFPLIPAPASFINAPDSIQLKNIITKTVYVLKMGSGAYKEAYFHVQDYKGKIGSVDLMEFRFGNAKPDTLQVTIGTIQGWRGDECSFVNDPGITDVKQNGTTIYQYKKYADSAFTIKK